jgi:ABC-type branched-subunit amino acid transport system substrate-binding protein/serine/threonine protein kinase
MQIYCTRLGCTRPLNVFPDLDDSTLLKTVPQRYCHECGMPLILDSRYIPVQLIRQGGFGTVFLAWDRRTPKFKRCIVKQLQFNPQFNTAQVTTATTLFHREAEVLETLGEHPRIPRFFAFLELEAPEVRDSQYRVQKFCYLVQDYIEGQDLQQELLQHQSLSAAAVREILEQVLPILAFIHDKGTIHRDIKPSNIVRDSRGDLHLIDFGAVKQIISTATIIPAQGASSLTGVCTPEYAPLEQRQCSAIYPSSDLYALGVTCIHLLTGEQPSTLFDYQTYSWRWDKIPIEPHDSLRLVLERMLQEAQLKRFQSARDVLQALTQPGNITTLPDPIDKHDRTRLLPPMLKQGLGNKKLLMGGVAIASVAIGGIAIHQLLQPRLVHSAGDRILMTDTAAEAKNYPQFQALNQAGAAAMAARNYPLAAQKFQAALQQRPNAPETRIYLNNAAIGSQPSYTIAVAVPMTDDSRYRSLEMLRGFAHAQRQINSSNKIKIKLEIFNDEDKPNKAEAIAKSVVDRSDILAVVGHNSSAVSLAAAKIYNSRGLVFITPIGTTTELTGSDRPYIFRTNVRSDWVAQKLARSMLDDTKKRRAAVFYVPGVPYSEDLKAQFSNQLASGGGEVVGTFDLTDGSASVQQAVKLGAEAIVLFPTHKYRTNAWNVLRDKQRRQPNLSVFGDIATLYNYDTLQQAGEAARDMVLGVSWHNGDSDPQFIKQSNELWRGGVNWATATSYNAISAIGTAINATGTPSRQMVQQNLSSLKFPGAAGSFQFYGGESQNKVTMVRVQQTAIDYPYGSGTGQDFLPFRKAVAERSPRSIPSSPPNVGATTAQ